MISWLIKSFVELDTTELFDILKLRQEVFILEQDCVYPDIDDLDKHGIHLFGYVVNGHAAKELCVYARIIPPGEKFAEAAIGRVIVRSGYRGRGFGAVLMEKALAVTLQHFPSSSVRISAQAHLQDFYQGIGFVCVSEPYDEDGIPHIDMLR